MPIFLTLKIVSGFSVCTVTLNFKNLNSFGYSINPNDEWVTLGDFNQVLNINDKLSFKKCTLKSSNNFNECLNECNFSEIPPKGQFMTWTNNKEWEEVI